MWMTGKIIILCPLIGPLKSKEATWPLEKVVPIFPHSPWGKIFLPHYSPFPMGKKFDGDMSTLKQSHLQVLGFHKLRNCLSAFEVLHILRIVEQQSLPFTINIKVNICLWMNKSYEIAKLRRHQDDPDRFQVSCQCLFSFLFESIFGLSFCFSCFSNWIFCSITSVSRHEIGEKSEKSKLRTFNLSILHSL